MACRRTRFGKSSWWWRSMPACPPASTVFESRARCSPNWTRFEGGQDFIGHCEEPTGPAFGGPDDKLPDEAIHLSAPGDLDCFAEPVIRRRLSPTPWVA